MWHAFFYEILTKYISDCQKRCFVFVRESILKQNVSRRSQSAATQTVPQFNYFFFWLSEDLPYYNPSYVLITALGELLLIITIRMEHVTYASALLFAQQSQKSLLPTLPVRLLFFLHVPDLGAHITRPDQGLLADQKGDTGNEVKNPYLKTSKFKIYSILTNY